MPILIDRNYDCIKRFNFVLNPQLQAILGCKIGGIYDLEEELSEKVKSLTGFLLLLFPGYISMHFDFFRGVGCCTDIM